MSSHPHPTDSPTATAGRAPLPPVASLAVNPDRLDQMWKLTPDQRVLEARRGRYTLGEMSRWSARRPHEVPLVEGEFLFLAALSADAAVGSG